MSTPTAAIAAWICRCVQRLTRQYRSRAPLPTGDRGLNWLEYTRLVEQIMAEFRED